MKVLKMAKVDNIKNVLDMITKFYLSSKVDKPIGFCFFVWDDKNFNTLFDGVTTLDHLNTILYEFVKIREETKKRVEQ